MAKSALLLGATGLIGQELLIQLLSSDYDRVLVWSRREIHVTHPKLVVQIVDFAQLPTELPFSIQDVFCTLGTTIRQAGSQEEFKKVDFHYVLNVAKVALAQKAQRFFVVTSMGAHSQSIIFYNRVKGDLERALTDLKFSALHIFQPSLLLGMRREARTVEQIAQNLLKPVQKYWPRSLLLWSPIEAKVVARAMVRAAHFRRSGVHIYKSNEIQEMGK